MKRRPEAADEEAPEEAQGLPGMVEDEPLEEAEFAPLSEPPGEKWRLQT